MNKLQCEECGAEFVPMYVQQRFCCKECQWKSELRRRQEKYPMVNARRREERRRKKQGRSFESIAEVQMKARAAGMTYGKYLAAQAAQRDAEARRGINTQPDAENAADGV